MKYEQDRSVREMRDAADYLRSSETVQRAVDMADVVNIARSPMRDPEKVARDILKDIDDYADATPFLGKCQELKAGPKDVVLIVAASGQGKSTLSAEIAMSHKSASKPILIISNEESKIDIYRRLACFELGLPTKKVNLGDLAEHMREPFANMVISLHDKIHVIAKDAGQGSAIEPTMTAEAIHGMLDEAVGKYSAVIIDYFTQIKHTTKYLTQGQDHLAQKEFVSKLDVYRDTLGCPLYLFAQSAALNKNSERSDYTGGRTRGSKEVLDKVTLCFEIQKFVVDAGGKKKTDNLEDKVELAEHAVNGQLTFLYLHKWRRGGDEGSALVFQFNRGRYNYLTMLSPDKVRGL